MPSCGFSRGRVLDRHRRQFQRLLFLQLPLTPELEDALPDPEEAQAVEEEAQNAEIPQEYRVA